MTRHRRLPPSWQQSRRSPTRPAAAGTWPSFRRTRRQVWGGQRSRVGAGACEGRRQGRVHVQCWACVLNACGCCCPRHTAAAQAATEAAAKELEAGKPGAAPAAGTAPKFNFGAPATASSAAALPAFLAAAASSAAPAGGETAPKFSFGAPAAASSAAAAPPLMFGATASAASTPAFSFGGASSAAAAEVSAPASSAAAASGWGEAFLKVRQLAGSPHVRIAWAAAAASHSHSRLLLCPLLPTGQPGGCDRSQRCGSQGH